MRTAPDRYLDFGFGPVNLMPSVFLRNECAWIELDGNVHRATRLFTRRVVSRRVREVLSLFTDVRWFGHVHAVEVRF